MKLIVGLGNPGLSYVNTRHNIGFKVLDKLCEIYKINMCFKHKALFGVCDKIIFAKPQTFMNSSGECVHEIISYYKINLHDIIIIYDDMDIKLGEIKIKSTGSSGGHNGIKNIINILGTQNINRIRIGIDKAPKNFEINNYVLSKFLDCELEKINYAINLACEAIDFILKNNIISAMNKFNVRIK